MPGVRKIKPTGVGVADTRVAVVLPKEIGRQLRALAARRNSTVAPILRQWIIEKLAQADAMEPAVFIVNPAYSSDPAMLTKAGRALMLADLPADFIVRPKSLT